MYVDNRIVSAFRWPSNCCDRNGTTLTSRKWLLQIVCCSVMGLLVGCDQGSSGGGSTDETIDDPTSQALSSENFFADRQLLVEGEETTLRWNVPDGTNLSITPDIGAVALTGDIKIAPARTTVFTLTGTVDGTAVTGEVTITVRPFAAVTLVANVASGDAPLTVRFTPLVDSVTAINRYFWDFNGDGGPIDGGLGDGENGFDSLGFGAGNYDVTGRELTFTYDSPGTYNPRIRVWDEAGNQAESTLEIVVANAPPKAYLRAAPTSGQVPLRVRLTAVASDNEGRIGSYEWDFDGDGVYDETTGTGAVTHTYEVAGKFNVGVRITDAEGASTQLSPIHLAVNAAATEVPTVQMNTRTTEGDAPLLVSFTTSGVSDPGRTGIVAWQWDFDGDGVVDADTERSAEFTYEAVGDFYPGVRVIAADGTVGTDIMNIRVNADHAFSVVDAAINPELGATSTVNVSLRGTTDVALTMQDVAGQTVHTLWPLQTRKTGDYSVTWNGLSDSGAVLPPGDYYAVLRYVDKDGLETILDYRASTGGRIFYPSGWPGSGCRGTDRAVDECGVLTVSDNELEPFNNKPTVFGFTNPNIARMTGYLTVIGSDDFAPASFFRSRLMPPGDYTIRWFGEGTNGRMLPRFDRGGYLPAIFGLTASDNAIYLTHQTRIGTLSVEPPIVYPAGSGNDAISRLTFEISRAADVELTINSTDTGVEVFRRTYPDIAGGSSQSISWDGRSNSGEFVAPGGYRLSVQAIDSYGQATLPSHAMQRVEY